MDEASEVVLSGNDVVEIKIVRSVDEIDNENDYFGPDMCHQVFGQSETVYGYKGLKIRLIYDASHFYCYATSSYKHKVKPDPVSGLEPDDYMTKLKSWIPEDYVTDKEEFKKLALKPKKPEVFGEILHAFKLKENREFEIRLVDGTTPGYEEFHQRLETLIVWYIDAANFIDVLDPKWRFYVVFEKVKKNNIDHYYALGFATVYEYFAFPDKHRYRISQFIIFPPYQNLGLGTELLKTIYKNIQTLPKVQDITVEEPSEKFQTLRDFVDIEFCKKLPSFDEKFLKDKFNSNMIKEAKETLKLNDKQIRRIYEILRLSVTNSKNAIECKNYKDMVRQRLSAPFARQEKLAKCRKMFHNSNIQIDLQEVEHNESLIENEYCQLMKNYNHVLNKCKNTV